LDPAVSLRSRQTSGSPNPAEVKRMIQERRRRLDDSRAELKTEVQRLGKTLDELLEIVRSTTRVG
ncbi:MAG: argininosuccinate lyase, partial [Candidatus Bathyarchaeia archaeon]